MQLTELGDTINGTIYPENANPTTGKSTMQRYPWQHWQFVQTTDTDIPNSIDSLYRLQSL